MGKDLQKTIVSLHKEVCNKDNLYATINLDAMNAAAVDLDAGAFKLWMYFAKNNEAYKNWELSSKAVERDFGIKIKQYNNAVSQLIEKGYLVEYEDNDNPISNKWEFFELPTLITKSNKVEKEENRTYDEKYQGLDTKSNNPLLPKVISPYCQKQQALAPKLTTNITDNTNNTDIIENNTLPLIRPKSSLQDLIREINDEDTSYNQVINQHSLKEQMESLSVMNIKARHYMTIEAIKAKYPQVVIEKYNRLMKSSAV